MMPLRIDRRSLAALPGVVFSVFPTLVCPGCWPAYTGFLSALGLPFIPSGAYLLPATIVFVAIAVIALGLGQRRRHRSGPLLLGLAGSAAVLVGRFVLEMRPLAYTGAAMLLIGSVWKSMPRQAPVPVTCRNCGPKHET